jgi:hypothetical protein
MTAYDIFGDIHGSADKLVGLLAVLGYRVVDGAHRHPDRTAVFVGDLMDRGPRQVEVVQIVRAMHDAGAALAVLGNHEFNALSYATPDPGTPGDFARSHRGRRGAHNTRQHQAYLDQVVEGSDLHRAHLAWFRTLPLHLDLGSLRVAHACWHPASLAVLDKWVPPGSPLGDTFVVEANTRGTEAFDAVEVVLKGPELHLPAELAWIDPERTLRHAARLRWWDDTAVTCREVGMIPPGSRTPDGAPHLGLPDTPSDVADAFRYRDDVPVFFGHYWFTGTPAPAARHAVCVDYSAARDGSSLVAYRWDGESVPTADRFVAFPGSTGPPTDPLS